MRELWTSVFFSFYLFYLACRCRRKRSVASSFWPRSRGSSRAGPGSCASSWTFRRSSGRCGGTGGCTRRRRWACRQTRGTWGGWRWARSSWRTSSKAPRLPRRSGAISLLISRSVVVCNCLKCLRYALVVRFVKKSLK